MTDNEAKVIKEVIGKLTVAILDLRVEVAQLKDRIVTLERIMESN